MRCGDITGRTNKTIDLIMRVVLRVGWVERSKIQDGWCRSELCVLSMKVNLQNLWVVLI